MKIVWTEPAIHDLDNIHSYISKDSARYASILVEKILKSTDNLELFPLMGRVVPEEGMDSIREIFAHPYRIIYRISNTIEILAVIHEARDIRMKEIL